MMFKFLAAVAPAFLATAVAAYPDYPQWTTDIPVDADYVIGSEFVLSWVPQDTTETFKLYLGAFNNTPSGYYTGPFGAQLPIYDNKGMYLNEAVPFSDSEYRWDVQAVDPKWKGDGFYYRFTAEFENPLYASSSPRAFHVVD
ncbi:hypothetical protein F5B22DRAFT_224651 [Xylaria bambusicola]|uniref:uncharacterized protein n=1 Tax=Xylaria bambusicola TaxID=326684 RepID=UPI0020081B64|nr:uncharacterized protein F5B22DRAFT_224651 [Xylaria bambusicola]KAI0514607.1 hypothetical protein F5B22DRAFT_224651 [Xylaria bambusicola]